MNRIGLMLGIGAFALMAAACGRQEATGPATDTEAQGGTTGTATQPYETAPPAQDPYADPATQPTEPGMTEPGATTAPGQTAEPGATTQQPGTTAEPTGTEEPPRQ